MEEEPAIAEVAGVSKVDAEVDYVETEEPKLIELKPVSYDVEDVANSKTDVFDKMDIDNHNVHYDQDPANTESEHDTNEEPSESTENSVEEPIEAPESTPKVNGVLKYAEKKSTETSPNSTPGKSRYGRVRKPKLSTDFISVDRKSFAVLSNTSSYEHVYADNTPGKTPGRGRPRKHPVKNVKVETPKPDQPSTSLKESNEEVGDAEIIPDKQKDTPKPEKSSSNTSKAEKSSSSTSKPVKSSSSTPKTVESTPKTPKPTKPKTPKAAKSPKTAKLPKEDSVEASVSPLTAKDTIKTYSRKGEVSTTSSASEDNQTEKIDEERSSQISHVELTWKVGDVAWAKIGCYSYWPSIVTLECGSSIYVKSVGNRRLAVHVQFFGDRGRRSWVWTTSLIKYQSKEQFLELKKQHKKDKIRFKYFQIKPNFQDLWEKAVTEADTVLKLPHEERIPYYQSLYPVIEKSAVADTNSLKPKRPIISRRKNPQETRGRKRKIPNDSSSSSASKIPRDTASESSEAASGDQKLPNSESTTVKKRRPLDDHIKKRRAFERRMNKILRQSNTNGGPSNKNPKNGLKQRGKNAKFDKLLDKENERKKQEKTTEEQAGSSSSPDSDDKKKDISVYDFESDEETDVFIGTYNSRLTPQILAKIEQEKEEDDSTKPSTSKLESESESGPAEKVPEDGNLSSNEIKARRLFSEDTKRTKERPKDTEYVRPKGTASKFSKLFEHRKAGQRGGINRIAARRANAVGTKATKKLRRRGRPARDKINKQELPVVADKKDSKEIRQIGDFDVFKEKMAAKVDTDHPEFNDEQVDEYLGKLWSELDDTEKAKYKPDYEMTSEDDDVKSSSNETDDVKSSGNEIDDEATKPDEKRRSSSPSTTTLPSSSKPKKLANLFLGYKNEKVCQICEIPGDTVRCRGPCGGTFHPECVQKLIADKKAGLTGNTPPRRGRRSKKPSLRRTAELSAKVEPTKMDVDEEIVAEKKTTPPKRGRKSLAARNAAKEESGDEFVKPVLRRSRRMEDAVKNIGDKKNQSNKDNETESETSSDEKMEVDEPTVESAAAGEETPAADNDESTVEQTTAAEDKSIPEPAAVASADEAKNNDDGIKEEKEEHIEDSIESETEKIDEEVKTEKTINEDDNKSDELAESDVGDEKIEAESDTPTENEVKDEKIISNDEEVDLQDDEKIPTSDKESSPEESVKSETTSETSSVQTSKTDKSSNGIDFLCNLCAEGIMYPCFACGKDEQEKTGETERIPCHQSSCARVYHRECIKSWPQATWITNNSKPKNGSGSSTLKESLLCPQHYCHTCISDNPSALKSRQGQAKLVKCIKCPTTYHQNVYCIPAGSELLNTSQIICPRHYVPPKLKSTHVNTSWCFICCIGGSLICCEECPTSFHAECLKLSPEEYEGRYICEDCQTGRYLLYGEIVWVKLGHYRWWPAEILYPQLTPDNIANMPHNRGEFAVRFFGSHDYNWVNRGRAFVYQEGDSGKKNCHRTVVDLSFDKALKEAEEAYQKLKIAKAYREQEAMLGLKPPRYQRIKCNKPIGNVRIVELNTSNIPECRCDPNSERPCAPESDCLNRILLVECNPRVCAAGERCLNQAFEKKVYPPLEPYRTDRRGWGLKTLVDIKKGDFIIEYVGEMIDEEEYKRRVNHMYKNQEENYYFLTIDQNRMLDAGPKGNVSRFMNHSCDPNCETQKWTVNGDTRVGLFAVKDIPANAELVFNYNLATAGNEKKPCLCGSEKCSGFIGVKAVKNGNNGNNGSSSNADEEGRKKSNEDNRKKSLDETKNGGNGANNAKPGTAKNTRRKGARKRKAPVNKRVAAEPAAAAAASTLPIKKRKLSAKLAAKTEEPVEDSPKSSPKHEEPEPEKNSDEGSYEESDTKEPASELTEKSEPDPETPENPTADSSPPKNEQNEEDKPQAENDSDDDSSPDVTEIELSDSTDLPIAPINIVTEEEDDESPSTSGEQSKKPKTSKKPVKGGQKKKAALGKQKSGSMSQQRGRKPVHHKNKKMANAVAKAAKTAPTIKVKSVEQRVVGKRGRKPHLTEEDRELALYKSLKKRLHKKIRAMTGIIKLDEDCFMCKEKGELIFCDNKKCPKGYHIPCVKKVFKLPKGRWLCPWHYCTVCKSKCKVAKCTRCINSYCRPHIEDNIYITCEESLICKDHKIEYLADKLQVLSTTHSDSILNTSTDDNDSSNFNESASQIIDADSLLIPYRAPKPKPKPVTKPRNLYSHSHMLPPYIKIKQESLSDSEIDPDADQKPIIKYIGDNQNVAKCSKTLGKKRKRQTVSIDNMSIDEFIEVHHVESIELVSTTEMSDDDDDEDEEDTTTQSNEESSEEEYDDAETETETVEKPSESLANSTEEESDDDYLDVEMEVIQDDSS